MVISIIVIGVLWTQVKVLCFHIFVIEVFLYSRISLVDPSRTSSVLLQKLLHWVMSLVSLIMWPLSRLMESVKCRMRHGWHVIMSSILPVCSLSFHCDWQLISYDVSELVSLLRPASCLSNNAASTSVPGNSSFRQPGSLKLLTAVVICRQKRKLFFRGQWLSSCQIVWTVIPLVLLLLL